MKETEQTLLEKIKDDVAQDQFGVLWIDLGGRGEKTCWPIVCERYATAKAQASCEATLKNASENVVFTEI